MRLELDDSTWDQVHSTSVRILKKRVFLVFQDWGFSRNDSFRVIFQPDLFAEYFSEFRISSEVPFYHDLKRDRLLKIIFFASLQLKSLIRKDFAISVVEKTRSNFEGTKQKLIVQKRSGEKLEVIAKGEGRLLWRKLDSAWKPKKSFKI